VREEAKGEDALTVKMDCADEPEFVSANIEDVNRVAAGDAHRIGMRIGRADIPDVAPSGAADRLAPPAQLRSGSGVPRSRLMEKGIFDDSHGYKMYPTGRKTQEPSAFRFHPPRLCGNTRPSGSRIANIIRAARFSEPNLAAPTLRVIFPIILLALSSALCGAAGPDATWRRIDDDDDAAVSYSSDALTGHDPSWIGEAVLPVQVPYLNPPRRYAIGSGVAMAVANVAGDWSQLAGPGYTTPNLINSEQLTLEIDGDEQPLRFQMKRAAQTGIYYGVAVRGDLRIVSVDFARFGQPWVSRLLVIDNLSATTAHDVRVRAVIAPNPAAGISHGLVEDRNQGPCGVFLRATALANSLYFGHRNPNEASAVAAYTDPAAKANHTDAA